ncbi:creatininase family protein [Sulfitobacter sp. F26204]|uniref:creatininase family protein n=1 Tax=Sulfitobacter sp. F26204 TaxID=2996014 RepID=UPI00225E2C0E|nr:creatininase family protein [Sulfitobacter sp. F26204]MCX7559174.1 creatininase family protein [Sulfitobacter sp. F26204]
MVEVEWQRLKAQELRNLADQDAVVILPVASIEQHGPHLPTMVDTRLGHEVAVRAARKAYPTRPVVVTPVVWAGLSEHHMPFGGTLTVSHATFHAVLRDLVDSITRHGFHDIVISNSHGGNMTAMQHFCEEMSPRLDATLVAVTYPAEAADEIGKILEDQENLSHACEAETSMMMAVEGELVDTSDLAALNNADGAGAGFLGAGKAAYRWRPYTQTTSHGATGMPGRSSADKGERLFEAAAEAIAAMILDADTWAAPVDQRGSGAGGVPFRR